MIDYLPMKSNSYKVIEYEDYIRNYRKNQEFC